MNYEAEDFEITEMDFGMLEGVALVVLYNGDFELVGMGNEDFSMLLYIEIL